MYSYLTLYDRAMFPDVEFPFLSFGYSLKTHKKLSITENVICVIGVSRAKIFWGGALSMKKVPRSTFLGHVSRKSKHYYKHDETS